MPTLRGEITGQYNRVNNRFTKYTIELPANMAGEFITGFSSDDVVTINGNHVNPAFGTIRLSPGKNDIEIRVNSF